MGAKTGISWCDHTFNPWWGCTKISQACENCYAEAWAERTSSDSLWGPDASRRFFGTKHWAEPRRWDAKAKADGVRRRVFCGSMCDVFERHSDGEVNDMLDAERRQLWVLIDETPNLDWLLLTKRPANIYWTSPLHYTANLWLGTTAEDHEQWDKRMPELLKHRLIAARLFVSCEPLLGPVDISKLASGSPEDTGGVNPDGSAILLPGRPRIDWIIVGGESGLNARPMRESWATSLRDQCRELGIAFWFKQWGEWAPGDPQAAALLECGRMWPDNTASIQVGKTKSGCLLRGVEYKEFPV